MHGRLIVDLSKIWKMFIPVRAHNVSRFLGIRSLTWNEFVEENTTKVKKKDQNKV